MSENKKTKRQNGNYPSSLCRYTVGGRQFTVTRHFTGSKDVNTLMTEIAVRTANREIGL